MGQNNTYGGLIWTNHALERLLERGITQELVWTAFKNPDITSPGTDNALRSTKHFGVHTVTVTTKLNDRKETIVISCWANPPFPGSIDLKNKAEFQKMQKASFWGKFFLTLKKQLGF